MNEIDYENLENQEILKLRISENEDMYCFWLLKGKLMLEFDYIKQSETFNLLEGEIAEAIAQSGLPDKIKQERVFEALSHALWKIK